MEKLKKENGGIKLITLISIILGIIIVLFVLAEYTINVKKDINKVSINNQTNASGNKQISEQKSEEIINEKYQLASKLINLDSTYFDISKNPIEKINSDNVKGYYYKINNYEEICDKYLTSECKKYFDEKAICLVWIQNEAYIAEGGASPSQNGGIEFYNINTTESEISATVRMTIIEPDTNNILGFAENTFKLVLENEEWKIAEYKSENELENWSKVVWNEEVTSQSEGDVNQDMASQIEGDVNQDGKVDNEDLKMLSNYMANYNDETNTSSVQLTDEQKELADVNQDGIINGKDVMMLSRKEEASRYQLGDVNQDGKLSQEDVDLLYDYVRGVGQLNEVQKELADIISDGKINTRDVSKLNAIIKASEFEKGDINQDGKVD
ncbi:MAG: dockerin type I repeat-containing protein, partial [Clostridia bacterium]|nr:dockerin type I repeat-containing protein [Clostridia bacterium]